MRTTCFFDKFAGTSSREDFSFVPENYQPEKHKYVVILGTVLSGLGKGIFSSNLAKLIKSQGYRVTSMKFDGYLNVDAGTLSPYRHGEVFVLDDGTECDMDLGTYERFLEQKLFSKNYLTAGRLFLNIIEKERGGDFLGRDVQFIPHVTGEIKGFVRNLAQSDNADIVFVEVGGTVGDLENSYFVEAMRQLQYEEGRENVCFVSLCYIPRPDVLKEQKSKPAQLGLRAVMALGISNDFIVTRSEKPISESIIEKLSIFGNVPKDHVFDMHDIDSVYLITKEMEAQNLDNKFLARLNLEPKKRNLTEWNKFVEKRLNLKKTVTVAITGKYTALRDSYASIINALEHAGVANNCKVEIKWVETSDDCDFSKELKDVKGVIVPPGFGSRGVEGKIKCVQYCRENNVPYLGLCYGFQMALIEYARNILGLKGANTTEVDPNTAYPVIDILPENKKSEQAGGTLRLGGHDVVIVQHTKAYKIYKSEKIRERFRHRYECNPDYIEKFEKAGVAFSGSAGDRRIMQILELPEKKFFMGTQFHPEFTSTPLNPNPIFVEFIKNCLT